MLQTSLLPHCCDKIDVHTGIQTQYPNCTTSKKAHTINDKNKCIYLYIVVYDSISRYM